MLAVVSVFFELVREPVATSPQGVRALRRDDMIRHARLQAPRQVVACLNAIVEALQNATGRPAAALTPIDGAGHCLVAKASAKRIVAVWQDVAAARGLAHPSDTPAASAPHSATPAAQGPYSMSMPTFTTQA